MLLRPAAHSGRARAARAAGAVATRRMSARRAAERGRLALCRERIDAIDRQIVSLLNRRAAVVRVIGEIKKSRGIEVVDPRREEEVLARIEAANPGPFPNESLRGIYREIFAASHQLEEPLTVAYFGPQATFTHQACRHVFGSAARALPRASIREVFRAVERDEAAFGVVPVENSTEGVVNHTLDMFLESPLTIFTEVVLVVHHHLLSRSGRLAESATSTRTPSRSRSARSGCRGTSPRSPSARSRAPPRPRAAPPRTRPAPRSPAASPARSTGCARCGATSRTATTT